MTLDVKVNIKLAEVVGNAGTWFPCLYIIDNSLDAETYDEYNKLSELVDTESGKTVYAAESAVYAAASKLFAQDEAPDKIAVLAQPAFSVASLDAHATKSWRQLVLVGDHTDVATIAEYVEGTEKLMLFTVVSEKDALKTLYTSVKGFDRTFIVYHTTDANAHAAVVGATAGLDAGSFTYKNMKIKGVVAETMSASELEEIHKNGAVTIVEKVGDIVTSEGKVASGEYADVVDSKDYIIQQITYKTQKVYNNNKKVPYTNSGIAMLEIATLEALKSAYNNGMIADNDDGTPAYNTDFALRSETTEADRSNRYYPYGTFTFALAGAIHNSVVNGTVTV